MVCGRPPVIALLEEGPDDKWLFQFGLTQSRLSDIILLVFDGKIVSDLTAVSCSISIG